MPPPAVPPSAGSAASPEYHRIRRSDPPFDSADTVVVTAMSTWRARHSLPPGPLVAVPRFLAPHHPRGGTPAADVDARPSSCPVFRPLMDKLRRYPSSAVG